MNRAVVVVNRDLVVEARNDRAEDLWGVRSDEAQGTLLAALDIGLDIGALEEPLRLVLGGAQRGLELELPARNRRGQPVRCSAVITPRLDPDGTVVGALVHLQEKRLDAE